MNSETDELKLYRVIPGYVEYLSDETKGGDKRVQQVKDKRSKSTENHKIFWQIFLKKCSHFRLECAIL